MQNLRTYLIFIIILNSCNGENSKENKEFKRVAVSNLLGYWQCDYNGNYREYEITDSLIYSFTIGTDYLYKSEALELHNDTLISRLDSAKYLIMKLDSFRLKFQSSEVVCSCNKIEPELKFKDLKDLNGDIDKFKKDFIDRKEIFYLTANTP